MAAAFQASPTAMQQPVAIAYATPRPATATAPRPARPAPRASHAATATRPAATVSWDRIDPSAGEPSFLQRITPLHMGVLMVMVMIAMVASSGPATMSIKPARLPALAAGGGTGGDPLLPPRAGSTAVDAARVSGAHAGHAGHGTAAKPTPAAGKTKVAKTDASTTRARVQLRARDWIVVGNARLRRTVRSGGIPSPAAAANLVVAGGGRVAANSTDAVNMRGIPSAAAAENLGPETLPYRPTDGVTLPRMAGERDSHAVDSHYGRDTLPMEAAVATPALTPGAAAEQAEQRATRQEHFGEDAAHAPSTSFITAT